MRNNEQDAFIRLEALPDAQGRVQDFRLLDLNPQAEALLKLCAATLSEGLLLRQLPLLAQPPLFQYCVAAWETRQPQQFHLPPPDSGSQADDPRQFCQVLPLPDGVVLLLRGLQPPQQSAALEAAQQRAEGLNTLLDKVAHEFRTPLTIIGSTLYMLEREPVAPQIAPRVDKLKLQAQRLEKLLEEVLIHARLDKPGHELPPATNLGDILESAFHTLRGQVQLKRIHFSQELSPGPLLVAGDEEAIFQALNNVLENAVRFTPAGGQVLVRAYPEGDYVALEVHDTGAGIPAEALPHIYERFYRYNPHTESSGAGLGLCIAKRVVEAYQGSIQIDSVEGQGTSAYIMLPKAEFS